MSQLGTRPHSISIRDAIHCAVISVTAREDIQPGSPVCIEYGNAAYNASSERETIGVADPFLSGTIRTGSLFWVVLFPASITNLRHAWDHPRLGNDYAERSNDDDEDSDYDDECSNC